MDDLATYRARTVSENYEVVERIRLALGDLERIIQRVERASVLASTSGEYRDLLVDTAALNLHNFYTRLESVFQHIASFIDKSVPSGPDWHRDLLHQMSLNLLQVRPQVLSAGTVGLLRDYMGFRHIVRHLYTHDLDAARVWSLAGGLDRLFPQLRGELEAFVHSLEQVESE